jgi:glutathione S-transferase
MALLDRTFPNRPMLPTPGSAEAGTADALLRLERQLFGAWCDFVFRSSGARGKGAFMSVLSRVEAALAESARAGSPWLLGGLGPSVVDLQYVSHVERMNASCLYWKGLNIRNHPELPRLEAWLRAFEQRPEYLASKSDYYTHVWDIPPQYGDGVADGSADAVAAREAIDGGAWRLPLPDVNELSLEPLTALQQTGGQQAARIEAAWSLCRNGDAVARFAARGAGEPGRKRFQAPLADPTATPLEAAVAPTSAALRCIAAALISGQPASAAELRAAAGGLAREVSASLAYLRLRIGVPRDMSQPAAMQLRAHLTAAIELLS